jgi:hypothetical protein
MYETYDGFGITNKYKGKIIIERKGWGFTAR